MFKKVLVLSLFASAMALTQNVAAEDEGGLKVGTKAPDISMLEIKSNDSEAVGSVISRETSGQKFTVLNFMSAGCGACNQEMPAVVELVNQISSVATYKAVSLDRKKYEASFRLWLQEKKALGLVNYTFALDSDRLAASAYNIKYTPTMFIIDSKGVIIFSHVGAIDNSDIPEIKKVLGL